MGIDYKLLIYIYNNHIDGRREERFDIIHDFIAYKLPYITGNKKEIKQAYKNYLYDCMKYDIKYKEDDRIGKSKKIETESIENIEIDLECDIESKRELDQENIEKVELIIEYIKKLNSIDRELFKQYYINNLSIRNLSEKYDIKIWMIHRKVKKYKDDIKSLYEIDKHLPEIKLFISELKNRDYNFNIVDSLKIIHYHDILFRYKTDKYDKIDLSSYQMLEDIIKEIKK